MFPTLQDFVEKEIITTRFFKSPKEMMISMAGVAYRREGGGTGCLFNPNDKNISLAVSGHSNEQSEITVYHCFAGLFASRIYRCLTKPYEFFRLHLNVNDGNSDPEPEYGELLYTEERGIQTARVYIEHFGPQRIVPHEMIIDLLKHEALEEMIEPCPVKLTPKLELYSINMQTYPHPGLVPLTEGILASYVMASKPAKKEAVQ